MFTTEGDEMSGHDHVKELIPIYALGGLEMDEAAEVAEHLAACLSCRTELDSFAEVVDELALASAVVDPPPHLKRQLMHRVGTTAPAAGLPAKGRWWDRFASAAGRTLVTPRWQPVALLLIVALVISNVALLRRLDQSDAAPTFQGHTVVLTGTEAAAQASGLIYISQDGAHGTLIVENLPVLNDEQQYQLWLIQGDQRTSGAIFSVGRSGYYASQIYAPEPLSNYPGFGITIEPAGGSPGPTGAKVLGSQ